MEWFQDTLSLFRPAWRCDKYLVRQGWMCATEIRQRILSPAMQVPEHTQADRPFHLLTKPIGPICNLNCKYCFYLEKEKLYQGQHKWRMSDEVLEEYIRQYIQDQPISEISFAW
jgi:hypothetical protein